MEPVSDALFKVREATESAVAGTKRDCKIEAVMPVH